MTAESTYIRNIINANKNGNLAIFVGAGISKISETGTEKSLDWSELIENITVKIKKTHETDFLKIAQYFYNFEGKKEYYSYLRCSVHLSCTF
jgi:cytolysin (calcineurin-like family phosphatase)